MTKVKKKNAEKSVDKQEDDSFFHQGDDKLKADQDLSSMGAQSKAAEDPTGLEDDPVHLPVFPLQLRSDARAFALVNARHRTAGAQDDLKRLLLQFPWSYRFDIDPHTLHVGHVFFALSEIAAITGGVKGDLQKITHLRLVTNYMPAANKFADPVKDYAPRIKLSLSFSLSSDAQFEAALHDLRDQLEINSLMEAPTVFRHEKENYRFKSIFEGVDRFGGTRIPVSTDWIRDDSRKTPFERIAPPKEDIKVDATEVAPVAESDEKVKDTTPVVVRVVSEQATNTLADLSKSSHKDDQRRLDSIILRLTAQPKFKPLCLFEADGLSFTDNFPNFSEFSTFLSDQCMLSKLGDKTFGLPPILLLGEPGIGKTEFISQLSQVMKTGFLKVDMGSAQTGSSLAGSDIHWGNSRPGQFFDLLAFGQTANPIVFLDEIDKASTDSRHSPVGALYSLLEKKTAAKFCDLALPGVALDASHVIWVAAANDVRGIEPALLSRFRIFEIPAPTKAQMPTIVQSVYSSLLAAEKWGASFPVKLSEEVLREFDGIPARMARQTLEAAVGLAAREGRTALVASDIRPVTRSKRIGF